MRSIKELHYFDMLETGNFDRYQTGLARQDQRLSTLSETAQGQRARTIARKRADIADWARVVARRGDDLPAYRDYLTDGVGEAHLVADMTPAYATLPEARLAQMSRVAGDVRFLYLMRDPVARMWSQARMMARRAVADVADFPNKAVLVMNRALDRIATGVPDREDYIGAIGRLQATVAPQRLMLMFQDDMMTLPGLARLCAFLGIRPATADFDKRVLEGAPLPLGEELRARALRVLRPQYDFVARLFPDLPASWRQTLDEVHG